MNFKKFWIAAMCAGFAFVATTESQGKPIVAKFSPAVEASTHALLGPKITITVAQWVGSSLFCLWSGNTCVAEVEIEIDLPFFSINGNPLPTGAKVGAVTKHDRVSMTGSPSTVNIHDRVLPNGSFSSSPSVSYGIQIPTQTGYYNASAGGYLFYYYEI